VTTSPETIERIHQLEKDVIVLGRDSELQTQILEKLDASTDRLQLLVESMSRATAIHDEKFRTQDLINDQTDALIADRRAEAILATTRVIESLGELKTDLIARIEDVKFCVGAPQKEAAKNEKFDFLKTLVDNWKYILFAVAFGGGIVTHRWGFFQNLFN
jgi:PAS domain-containing protein